MLGSKKNTLDKKRLRSPDGNDKIKIQNQKRKLTGSNYWLATKTSNRFESLEEDNMETSLLEEDGKTKETEQNKEPKSPPIFVDSVENVNPLLELLNLIAKDNYVIKALGNNQVKIQPKNAEVYSAIIKALKEKNTQFHTYKLKQEKNFRVVIKNIHYSTDTQDIKKSIEEYGHTVVNVWNIKESKTKNPLPMFFVDLQKNENNKDIYEIKLLLNSCVTIETPYVKREIPQCIRCQRYGHTKNFCHKNPRCVKCAQDHFTSECPQKSKINDVRCVNCNENHPANYRGCKVHKELQQKLYPKLRERRISNSYMRNGLEPGTSYAQKVMQNEQMFREENNNIYTNQDYQNNNIEELKSMMKSMIAQMSTLINLITTLVNKTLQ